TPLNQCLTSRRPCLIYINTFKYNAHCNIGSCGLANPAQTIEIPDNPSPLKLFAIHSHTDLNCFHPAIVPQVEEMFGIAIP
ncbi:hypothetical protein, partial [Vibrio parahaemolyticus]|uniref:hypothetical protein n=1 Tax=Vibrio parahaemolyticus TaxID=670 RepID=UPI0021141E58|nr:hypothetical protein [Vibrio parahaemolyticus]